MKQLLLFSAILTLGISFAARAELILERKIKFGGQFTGGNTRVESLHFAFYLNRNRRWVDEVTARGSFYDESTGGVKSILKASAMLRYAFTFSEKYYNFYRAEFEHDRFKKLNLRAIPTAGLGHWWSDREDFKLMAEGALGYQQEYLEGGSETGKAILECRGFFSRKFLENAVFSQDLYLYPRVEDLGNYRLVSESALRLKLDENWSLNLDLLGEYNRQPPTGVEPGDFRFTTSLEYAHLLKLP